MKVTRTALGAALLCCATFAGAGTGFAHDTAAVQTISGSASWYGGKFHGRTTANGERFDMNALTAAHRSLPFGTKVRVTNRNNGKSIVVRINDRGPYHGNRVIDLSRGAAAALNMLNSGTAQVDLEVLGSSA